MKRRYTLAIGLAVALATLTASAQTAQWPTRSVRLIVPWAPGGSTDVIARTIAQKLSDRWGQQVVVDNKPGANSIIGAVEAARAAPDGYTLFMPISATLTANQFMYSKLQYKPEDFTLISIVASIPLVVMGSESTQGKTLPDLIALAKKNPDTVTFGSAAPAQIQVEQWMRDWGVKFRYVQYKSGIDVSKALLSNEIDLGVDAISTSLAHIKGGRIRGLAVSTDQRMQSIPGTSTMREMGLKHTEPTIWHGIVGPARLPADLQAKINKDIQDVLAMQDVNDKLTKDLGLTVVKGVGPKEFADTVRSEIVIVGPLIKELGLKVN